MSQSNLPPLYPDDPSFDPMQTLTMPGTPGRSPVTQGRARPDEATLDRLEAEAMRGEWSTRPGPARPIEGEIKEEAKRAVEHLLLDLAQINVAKQYIPRIEAQIANAESRLAGLEERMRALLTARANLDATAPQLADMPVESAEDLAAKAARAQVRSAHWRNLTGQVGKMDLAIKDQKERIADMRLDLAAVRRLAAAPCPDLAVLSPLYQSVDGWGDPVVPVK